MIIILVFIIVTVLFLLLQKWKEWNKLTTRMNQNITYMEDGEKVSMDVEEFLPCVVLKVWDVDASDELLKMQIVMARTNICRIMEDVKEKNAKEFSMPFYTRKELKKKLGIAYYWKISHIRKLVQDTSLQTITYKGKLITPYFHGISAGYTGDGVKATGDKACDYLVSKPSLWDMESSDYMKSMSIPLKKMCDTVNQKMKKKVLTPQHFFDEFAISENYGDYVKTVKFGKASVKGETFAQWFSLPSVCFSVYKIPAKPQKEVRIICKGIGNGLGVSLYGAKQMAANGNNYQDILKYYYKNVKIG